MMKTRLMLLTSLTLIFGCKKSETIIYEGLTDGLCIIANNKVILNHNDFEYYDYSSHLIYLKDDKSSHIIDNLPSFKVFADGKEIYEGHITSGLSSVMFLGAVIYKESYYSKDFVILIDFNEIIDKDGNKQQDVRKDSRIVNALKKYNQFREGLSCEIKSVKRLSSNSFTLNLLLKNKDSFDYYYLDPEKMGMNLFHYFTNGLIISDNKGIIYQNNTKHIKPELSDTWSKDWLSIISANSSKLITIEYNNFDKIPKGKYTARFEFPGLSYQVDKQDIKQKNGYIWLGKTEVSTDITIKP